MRALLIISVMIALGGAVIAVSSSGAGAPQSERPLIVNRPSQAELASLREEAGYEKASPSSALRDAAEAAARARSEAARAWSEMRAASAAYLTAVRRGGSAAQAAQRLSSAQQKLAAARRSEAVRATYRDKLRAATPAHA